MDAQTNLGMMYMGGHGVSRDPDAARQWLQKAADQGDAEAADLLEQISAQT